MTKIIWKELYTDLPTHIAEALRTARVKPEQIVAKTDGELMALEGIKEEDVNTIRAIYNTETAEGAKKTEVAEVIPTEVEGSQATAELKPKKVIAPRKRGKKYKLMAKDIKKDEMYSIEDAVAKLQKLSQNTKLKTVELTINTRETGLRGELKLPHSTGKELKIAIFSDQIFGVLSGFAQCQMNDRELGFSFVGKSSAGGEIRSSFLRIVGDGTGLGVRHESFGPQDLR